MNFVNAIDLPIGTLFEGIDVENNNQFPSVVHEWYGGILTRSFNERQRGNRCSTQFFNLLEPQTQSLKFSLDNNGKILTFSEDIVEVSFSKIPSLTSHLESIKNFGFFYYIRHHYDVSVVFGFRVADLSSIAAKYINYRKDHQYIKYHGISAFDSIVFLDQMNKAGGLTTIRVLEET